MTYLYAPSENADLANRSFLAASRQSASEQAGIAPKPATPLFAFGYGMAMTFLLCFGTGSAMTPQGGGQRESRQSAKEYKATAENLSVVVTHEAPAPRTAAEALAYVRSVLKPAVTELASMFQVSRQAIYNWQSGEYIAETNQALLFELAAAADTILAHPLSGKINVKRKLPGGETLLEAIGGGASGSEVAGKLISMAEKEGAQRAAVESRLGHRNRSAVDLSTVGSPGMYESV
ncbi:Cro/Cl family transcriptional regulator [Pseudomonas gingeri]|uniref:Cro/Cl family transcriptional regulator n=1 Tax=Pseudomonas gingeri TaxID=117681 RepID=A0A7Y7WW75_9PSED|nr:Cro/Cl family transcriptional regulator [Pseudomonas gingeri]NWB88808.1 Cro/Cl family transcriptional regulator [Pseudomonas gingeri]